MFYLVITVILFIVGAVIFSKFQIRKFSREWGETASGHGLRYVAAADYFTMGEIFGEIDGNSLNVYVAKEKKGENNSQDFTEYYLTFKNPLPLPIMIEKRTFFSKMALMLMHADDISLDDERFDSMTIVKSKASPESIGKFLNSKRREAILSLVELSDKLEIGTSSLTARSNGIDGRMKLGACLGALEAISKAFDEDDGETRKTRASSVHYSTQSIEDESLDERESSDGGSERSYSSGHDIDVQKSSSPATPPPLKKLKMQNGNFDSRRVEPVAPAAVISAPKPEEITQENLQFPESSAKPSHSDGLLCSKADFISAFFSSDSRPGLFDEKYRGAQVSWSCVVKNIRRTAFDLDFEDFKGLRVDAVIGQCDSFGDRKENVTAILAFRENVRAPSDADIGKEFHFSGKLVKIDPFLKKVFIDANNL